LIEQRIRTAPARFAAVLGPRPRARILIEASTDREWVARCLEQLGHEVIVADPNFALMYATRTRRIKTDRRDARALADANLLGAYRPAHRLSDAPRQVRGRLGVREALVRTRTRYIALSRARLRQHGYRVPSGGAEVFLDRVNAMPLPGQLRSLIAPLLAVMLPLHRQLAYSDTVIDQLAAHDPRVKRLRPVPSIGPVIAAAFVASLDDAQRFRHAHQVEAYLGLVPREGSSGDARRRGPITKAGPGRARWLLIQAAVSILRRRPAEAEALCTCPPPMLSEGLYEFDRPRSDRPVSWIRHLRFRLLQPIRQCLSHGIAPPAIARCSSALAGLLDLRYSVPSPRWQWAASGRMPSSVARARAW